MVDAADAHRLTIWRKRDRPYLLDLPHWEPGEFFPRQRLPETYGTIVTARGQHFAVSGKDNRGNLGAVPEAHRSHPSQGTRGQRNTVLVRACMLLGARCFPVP